MSIVLSQTIGLAAVEVGSAGLSGPLEGVALRFELDGEAIAFTLNDAEARCLIAQIQRQLIQPVRQAEAEVARHWRRGA